MQTTTTKTYAPWFTELIQSFNTKAEALQLDEEVTEELRGLYIDKCKQQYAHGNKAGAAWMRKIIEEGKLKEKGSVHSTAREV